MTILDPKIRAIAEYFNFSIEWDNELEKWIIKNTDISFIGFYWSSHDDFGDFCYELKEYFSNE